MGQFAKNGYPYINIPILMVKMDIPMGHLPVVCKNGYPYIHQATSGKFARYSLQSKSSFHLK